MICPKCGQHRLRVLETRSNDDGTETRRRLICPDDHRWTTIELAETVVDTAGRKRIDAALATLRRGIKARQQAATRRELVAYLSELGRDTAEIAREAGCTTARVHQIFASLAESGDGKP